MKKMKYFALMSAIALTSAVGFTACSSSDEIVDNPDYNPETNSVKTAITMNVGRGGAQTRMASAITQNNGLDFRGMYQVFIYPANVTNSSAWAPIESGSAILDPVLSNETISGITATASNKTYSNVQVLIGTNNFLFYGRAGSAASAPTTTENKLSNGYTVPTFPTSSPTTAGISFAAQEIANTSASGWAEPVAVLTNYLNSIKTAFGSTAITNASFESLRLDFMKPGTPRAGSADAVLATVQHMYTTIDGLYASLNATEQGIADAVKTAITTAPGLLSSTTIAWATTGSPLVTQTTFPANVGLPLGAAQYQYNSSTGAFEYVTTETASVANTPVADFIYPSELFYFTNTPLKETANNVTWHTTTADWAAETYASGWTDAVQASSKNIALVNNVQYGVAQLATSVMCTPDENDKLYDNSADKDPTRTTNLAIAYTANMFPLTGVLIGTQPSTVGWNFLSTGGNFTKCIYDKNVTTYSGGSEVAIYANSGSYSGPNYTLVYDNNGYQNSSSEKYVNVCLEFTNYSGVDFYGKDGLIKNGQKFYLIGKLDPSTKNSTDIAALGFPTSAGSSNAVYYPSVNTRVFIQDYTTIAKFEITAGSATTKGSLANALSSIPDLKAVTQEIGLSVDLTWKTGLEYTVPLGQ